MSEFSFRTYIPLESRTNLGIPKTSHSRHLHQLGQVPSRVYTPYIVKLFFQSFSERLMGLPTSDSKPHPRIRLGLRVSDEPQTQQVETIGSWQLEGLNKHSWTFSRDLRKLIQKTFLSFRFLSSSSYSLILFSYIR